MKHDSSWIMLSDRKPTKEDGLYLIQDQRWVYQFLVMNTEGQVFVQLGLSDIWREDIVAWMKIPQLPVAPKSNPDDEAFDKWWRCNADATSAPSIMKGGSRRVWDAALAYRDGKWDGK